MAGFFDSTTETPEATRKLRVAILGYGPQSKSAYNYWINITDDVTICDANPDLQAQLSPDTQTRLGQNYLNNLDQFDVLVRSPGLHPREIVAANMQDPSILAAVTSNTNEFLRVCPTKNVIAVTGTKGKGTTSTLIAKMLEEVLTNNASTHMSRVHLGGNIGIPPLELLRNDIQPDDWVVLELANFQLIDLQYSPSIAVCLMVVPEHMDWHSDMAEYVAAKQQLFRWQAPGDTAIYYADNAQSREVVSISAGKKIPYYQAPGAYVESDALIVEGKTVCAASNIKLLGKHNWQNACAAVTAVWQLTDNIDAMRSVLMSFSGLEHRLELVREVSGVKYYDDSFGTTPETATVAIEAFSGPKILILGGSNKGASYDKLAQTVRAGNVKHVITIGEQGPKIAEALEINGYRAVTEGKNTMAKIVEQAQKLAASGDTVLLSTACASFDMFKNYKDRGEQFHKAVNGLIA